MSKTALIIFLISIISCAEKKHETNKVFSKETKISDQLAQIEFDTEIHDFGKIKSGEKLIYSFVLTNPGKANLIISKAEVDCGCIKTKIPMNPIKTGERGIIEVEFNSAGMIGKQLKTVEIQSNSKEPKHLIIFANIENEQIEFKY